MVSFTNGSSDDKYQPELKSGYFIFIIKNKHLHNQMCKCLFFKGGPNWA